jgi:hypothetical protein
LPGVATRRTRSSEARWGGGDPAGFAGGAGGKAPRGIDRLRAAIDAALAFHRERPQLITGLLQLWAIGGRDRAGALDRERRGVRAARDALIAELRGGIARRDVRPCDPERVVDLTLALVAGALVQHALGISPSEHVGDELARRVLELLRVQRRGGARRVGRGRA